LKHAGEELFKIYGVRSKREFMIRDEPKIQTQKQKLNSSMQSGEFANLPFEDKGRLSLPNINKNQ